MKESKGVGVRPSPLLLLWVLGVLADSPPGAKMIKILWQDWAHNWIFGIIRPTFGSNPSPWSWSLTKVHQPLLEVSLPFPGPHDYTCLTVFIRIHFLKLIFVNEYHFGFNAFLALIAATGILTSVICKRWIATTRKVEHKNIDWLWGKNSSAQQAGPVVSVPKGNSGHNCMNPQPRNSPHTQHLLQTHLV